MTKEQEIEFEKFSEKFKVEFDPDVIWKELSEKYTLDTEVIEKIANELNCYSNGLVEVLIKEYLTLSFYVPIEIETFIKYKNHNLKGD